MARIKVEKPADESVFSTDYSTITPDDLFEIKVAEANQEYVESEERLVSYVEKTIQNMNNDLLFKGGEPSFYQLNESLARFETTAFGLIGLYAVVRQDSLIAQEQYDDVYSGWFIEERENLAKLDTKKMPSTREIDMIVRSKHLRELAKLKATAIEAETKRSMVERLTKQWDSYNFVLSTLSRNLQSESNASRTTGNKTPDLGGDED
jgi:hypothetical protein